MIPLSNPDITEAEIQAVVAVLRSGRLSLGPKLTEFEQVTAEYIGLSHAIAVSSGTAGLHLALRALKIRPGDEIILPSFTFIAAANAILHQRATPVFADIDPITLNLDPTAVEQAITPRTRAILVVHTFGVPADMNALLAIAHRHCLHVIEDACEAIGAEYQGKKIGALGDIAVFSFYPNKPITTGEGGIVVTQDADYAYTIKALRNQGRTESDNWLEHSLLGYNYRLAEINCALGIEQLKRIESILSIRETIARKYCELLHQACPEIETPPVVLPNRSISWFAFIVRLPAGLSREQVMSHLANLGIASRDYFPPIHKMPLYSPYASAHLPITEELSQRTLALPFFNQLQDNEIRQVVRALSSYSK